MNEIKVSKITTILYEAPHKIIQTLKDLKEITKNRKIVLAMEITKIHEEYIFGTAEELMQEMNNPKGEFVIVIDKSIECANNLFDSMELKEHYEYYEKLGFDKKEIIKKIAKDRKVKKDEIYKEFIKKNTHA